MRVSNLNRPNVLKGTVLYRVPLGKGHQYLSSDIGDAVLGGWEASGDYVAESGAPFTVTMDDPATMARWVHPMAIVRRPGIPTFFESGIRVPGGIRSTQWFNQQAYASPAANTFGTNPRNSLTGPDFVWFDFSMAKSLSMPGWEAGKIQIRMDANNIFNHPAFNDPNSELSHADLGGTSSASVGTITGTDGKRSSDSALGSILVLRC